MPEFIIVGIKNTYRDGSKDGGRADRYIDFIRDELVPHIDKTCRTENFRVLYGTSNTGFTAVYALFRSPDLAHAYIAASATLAACDKEFWKTWPVLFAEMKKIQARYRTQPGAVIKEIKAKP